MCVVTRIPPLVDGSRRFAKNVTTTHILISVLALRRVSFKGRWIAFGASGVEGLVDARCKHSVDSVLGENGAARKTSELSVHVELSTRKVFRKIHVYVITLLIRFGENCVKYCVEDWGCCFVLCDYEKKLSIMRSKSVPVNIFIRKINTIYGKLFCVVSLLLDRFDEVKFFHELCVFYLTKLL